MPHYSDFIKSIYLPELANVFLIAYFIFHKLVLTINNEMIEWHKKLIRQMMKQLNLDTYQVAWISFLKGVLVTFIIYEFFLI